MKKRKSTTKSTSKEKSSSKQKSKAKAKIDFISHAGDYRPLRHLRKSLFRQNKSDSLSTM